MKLRECQQVRQNIYYKEVTMIDFLILTLPNQITYQGLKNPIVFSDYLQPYSCWAFKNPITIYSSDLKQRHIFQDGKVEIQNVLSPILQEKWKYFVMTKNDNSKVFCTSYVFYEKIKLKVVNTSFFPLKIQSEDNAQFYLPKCLILRSHKPYFKIQTNLIKIHRQLRHNNSWIFQQISKQNIWAYENELRSQDSKQASLKKFRSSLISFDKAKFNHSNNVKLPVSLEMIFNYYVSACNQIFIGEKKYIESHNNFQILHLYNISDSLYRVNYFFHLPISMDNLFIILAAIFQEKQIIFTSSNQNSNLMLMQTIVQMLAPLKWEYMYVPNLPQSMIDAAQYSFMPYMVGIHRKFLDKITPTGRVIVHVDHDKIEAHDTILPLPQMLKSILLISVGPSYGELKYIEWQSYFRIKCLLMISTLLVQFPLVQQKLAQNPDYEFYSYFFSQSAMYQYFKNQIHNQQIIQISQIMWLPFDLKLQIIESHFRHLINQANFPNICENQKQWIKYYYHKFQKGRRSLKNDLKYYLNISNSMAFMRSSVAIPRLQLRSEMKQRNPAHSKKGIGFVHSTIKF